MINLSKLAALAKATPKELAQSTSADALTQEKLTRRAALRRIGMTGAMTVLGVLSVDELARVASKKLDEHEMTRGLAKDFKNAGVAMADGDGGGGGGGTYPCDCHCQCDKTYASDSKACGTEPVFFLPLDTYLLFLAKWHNCTFQADLAHDVCGFNCDNKKPGHK